MQNQRERRVRERREWGREGREYRGRERDGGRERVLERVLASG